MVQFIKKIFIIAFLYFFYLFYFIERVPAREKCSSLKKDYNNTDSFIHSILTLVPSYIGLSVHKKSHRKKQEIKIRAEEPTPLPFDSLPPLENTSSIPLDIIISSPGIRNASVLIRILDPFDNLLFETLSSNGSDDSFVYHLGEPEKPSPIGFYKIIFYTNGTGSFVSDYGTVLLRSPTAENFIERSITTPSFNERDNHYIIFFHYPSLF